MMIEDLEMHLQMGEEDVTGDFAIIPESSHEALFAPNHAQRMLWKKQHMNELRQILSQDCHHLDIAGFV